jgi:hypothetical protein
MGLFDKAASFARNPMGAIQGELSGRSGSYGGEEQRLRTEMLQGLKRYRDKLSAQAKEYRSNIEDTRSKMFSQAKEGRRRNLAQTMTGVQRGANRRGLLYSGLRAGEEAGARQRTATGMAQDKEKINQQTEAKAAQMEQQAATAGLGTQQMGIDAKSDAYNQALQSRRDKLAAQRGLFQAAGSAGGMAAANRGSGGGMG